MLLVRLPSHPIIIGVVRIRRWSKGTGRFRGGRAIIAERRSLRVVSVRFAAATERQLGVWIDGHLARKGARGAARLQGGVERDMCPVAVAGGIGPPVGRPNAQDPPAQALQHELAQPVAVARGCTAMIGRSVTLNAGEIGAGRVRIDDPQVDAEAGDADLRMQRPAPRLQALGDSGLEGTFEVAERCGGRSKARAPCAA